MKNLYKGFVGAFIIALSVIGLTGCGSEHIASAQSVQMRTVKAEKIEPEAYTEYLAYTGYVDAEESLDLAFQTSGVVESVMATEGQFVSKGDVLISLKQERQKRSLDSQRDTLDKYALAVAQQENSLKQSALQLENKARDYAAATALYQSGAISKADFDAMTYDYESAKINHGNLVYALASANETLNQGQLAYEQAEQDYDSLILTSPIEGIVVSIDTEVNQSVNAGTSVIRVQSAEPVVKISVPVDDYKLIEKGQRVIVAEGDEAFSGQVGSVSLTPDQTTRTYAVEIEVQNRQLLFSSLVEIKIPLEDKTDYFVPLGSVVNISGINYVYKLVENEDQAGVYTVEQQQINLGVIYGDKVVISGIEEDIYIATDGVNLLKVNDQVKIIE